MPNDILKIDTPTYGKLINKLDDGTYAMTIPSDGYSYGSIKRDSFINMYDDDIMAALSVIKGNMNIAGGVDLEGDDVQKHLLNDFNRYKIQFPDTALGKSFSYTFITRPQLNLYDPDDLTHKKLLPNIENDPTYYYINRTNPDCLLSLTKHLSKSHDFNPFLSNKSQSTEISDEYIKTIDHGETYTGHKIKYGKNNIESKTAGQFSISYTDDRKLTIYNMHKAWVDYISKVSRGEFSPASENIVNRILDYAVSMYYILCAEDGETIIFWSKYTGIFPTNIPSSALGYSAGSPVQTPDYTINYEYAWKEDFNPYSLVEFNNLSTVIKSGTTEDFRYVKNYDSKVTGTGGKTFMGPPFIEAVVDTTKGTYTFKLRYRIPEGYRTSSWKSNTFYNTATSAKTV